MKKCAGCKKKNCNGCLLFEGQQFVTNKGEDQLLLADFSLDAQSGYGIAVDLGTTTICAMLFDLECAEQIGTSSCINPGRSVGSDMISRITYCLESKEQARKLQQSMVSRLDEMAKELWEEAVRTEKVKAKSTLAITKMIIAGNTAMSEIFLGLSLDGLAKAPFHKDYLKSVEVQGEVIGFSYLKHVKIIVLPSIDGYVGGDALCVYSYIKRLDERKNILAVDIGTNGEMLLISDKGDFAASAAAGPALEGAAVEQGMGATKGAISEVLVLDSFPRQDLYCKVIGGGKPIGICGSGLIDALAVLLQYHIIDETGYLRSAEEARRAGAPERLCRRIEACQVGESLQNRVLLTDKEHPVYLTAGDIRQLQLSKGAVRAGIEILLQRAELHVTDLKQIYLAGSFGNHIRVSSVMEIGLLPPVEESRVFYAGNCAGTGAVLALLSQEIISHMEQEAEKIVHVELADTKEFESLYLQHMQFDDLVCK